MDEARARAAAEDMTARLFVSLWIDRGKMPDQVVREMLILQTERVVADAVAQAVKERDAIIENCRDANANLREGVGRQAEEIAQLRAEVTQLGQAILWADGQHEDFRPREPGEGAYWWRKELMQRAGLRAPTEPAPGGPVRG